MQKKNAGYQQLRPFRNRLDTLRHYMQFERGLLNFGTCITHSLPTASDLYFSRTSYSVAISRPKRSSQYTSSYLKLGTTCLLTVEHTQQSTRPPQASVTLAAFDNVPAANYKVETFRFGIDSRARGAYTESCFLVFQSSPPTLLSHLYRVVAVPPLS